MAGDISSEVVDPTDCEDLAKQLDRVKTHLQKSNVTGKDCNRTSALVLAGGGGKGAYEAGCLLAFWDCGLRNFQAISGTSVGGLNAALFKRLLLDKDRSLILQVWSDMSFGRVLKGSPLTVIKLLLYIPISILSLTTLPKINRPHEGEMECGSDWLVKNLVISLGYIAAVIIGAATLSVILPWLRNPLIDKDNFDKTEFMIILSCIFIIVTLCRWLSSRLGLADNAPLRQTISSVYDDTLRDGDPAVICTLAAAVNGQRDQARASHATYSTLANAATKEEVIDLLLQTAALPEVFRMKKIRGNYYIDGGVEDNIPILGVYPIRPERVFVIYLDSCYNLMLEQRKKSHLGLVIQGVKTVWYRETALKLMESARLERITRRRGEVWEGPLSSWFQALELVPIIPDRSLGNFFFGTLNFSQKKSQELLRWGYEDTLKTLLAWQPKSDPSASEMQS
ncbi:patatin-like phospholipase family protein [uncultured Gimesia sp.]|uniref:patatin-like phospholipase family protein n=1 Tax=uncultured Gimesia sp. TaxID=1678688 RepID=UPI002634DCFB|nr:patatin-like phospholipase family protein [uncultured Gimesia sp.]